MPAPQLVIAVAPYKKYPGGVIAVSAADHLAAARGSLSTEADALSTTGTVVRDTQQVNNIRTAASTAYQAADDTLVITGVPFKDQRWYVLYVTFRIEGETDYTDGALLRTHTNENWANAVVMGAHTTTGTETTNFRRTTTPPPMPYYRALKIGAVETTTLRFFTGDSIFVRFASESGTSIQCVIDQLVFFPALLPDETEYPFASGSTLGTAAATQDGADGGDANGKFTWFARLPPDGISGEGDYQRKSDSSGAEYFTQVTTPDGQTFWSTNTEKGPSWMYSQHTSGYRGVRTWVHDTFDNRNTSATDQDMGISPDGFGYGIATSAGTPSNIAHVDGAGNCLLSAEHFNGLVQIDLGSASVGSSATSNQGMKLSLFDQWSWKTLFDMNANTDADGEVVFQILFYNVSNHFVQFDFATQAWELSLPVSGLQGSHDISSWFGPSASVGIRIEVSRYRLRVRVWDGSGAEPGTWDEDVFVDLNVLAYPYGDAEATSTRINAAVPKLAIIVDVYPAPSPTLPKGITIHDIEVTHDPYGDPADMTVRVERPPGSSLGDQIIPYGASYWVYWGKRDWTDNNGFGGDRLAWSAKVWNDLAAAEIQRAEVGSWLFYWFDEPLDLIPMNWRSADRSGHPWRVLSG